MKPFAGLLLAIPLGLLSAGSTIPSLRARETSMVMTVLEAHVAADRVADLERAYREGASTLTPDLVETYLVRDTKDTTLFRIMTVWVSREALDTMRASGEKPKGVQIFEAAGATPALSILDVVTRRSR
jgi:hypothetical protein